MAEDWTLDEALAYGDGLLHGELVQLRATEQDDHQRLADWWRDGATGVLSPPRYLPRPLEGMIELIDRLSGNARDSAFTSFSVTTHEGELIGHTSLMNLALPMRIAEFGITMAPGWTGRGYGTDTARVMVTSAFAELGANKVELHTHAFNDRAIRSYEKVGFAVEGRRRQAILKDGRLHDEMIMGVLAEEWDTATRRLRASVGPDE